jgi:hypothetical protein
MKDGPDAGPASFKAGRATAQRMVVVTGTLLANAQAACGYAMAWMGGQAENPGMGAAMAEVKAMDERFTEHVNALAIDQATLTEAEKATESR